MKVRIEKQSDGTYIAYNTDGEMVTLIGTGDTVAEAKADFYNSIKEIRAGYIEDGDEIPAELDSKVEFNFDISSLFEYYNVFNISALGRYLGINPGLMRQYKKGETSISDAQIKRIEDGIHKLAKDLANLSLS